MFGMVLFALYCLAGAIGAHADVTINYSAFKHSSGDHWVKVTAYCEGLQLHEWASGAPLDMDDCPKTLSGSVAATFPGSSGTYDIVLGIRAMDYGGGKWFLSVGGTQVGSGNSPKIPCADPCSKKCGGKCTVSVRQRAWLHTWYAGGRSGSGSRNTTASGRIRPGQSEYLIKRTQGRTWC